VPDEPPDTRPVRPVVGEDHREAFASRHPTISNRPFFYFLFIYRQI
jgi:hypothetical protein